MRKEGRLEMYEIKVKYNFSSAHNLRNYSGKCEKLHGHNWAVEASFLYKDLDKDGLAVDFRIAKTALNPTSENIARFIYDRIKKKIKNIKSVSVWENENSCAVYSE